MVFMQCSVYFPWRMIYTSLIPFKFIPRLHSVPSLEQIGKGFFTLGFYFLQNNVEVQKEMTLRGNSQDPTQVNFQLMNGMESVECLSNKGNH